MFDSVLTTFFFGCSDCSMIHLSRLEYHIREELNKTAPRTMVVLNPLKVGISRFKQSIRGWTRVLVCILLPVYRNLSYELHNQVIITNLEAGIVTDLDAKKWPEAPVNDASSFYKVGMHFLLYNNGCFLLFCLHII